MRQTDDGYLIPSPDSEEELIEAVEHNTLKKEQKTTETNPYIASAEASKRSRKAPKGYNKTGLKLDNYIDNVEIFHGHRPFFYDKNQLFWMWNLELSKYEIVDEIDIMNLIDAELGFGGQTVSSKIKGNYLEAFKRVGRLKIPQNIPNTWIQFKDKIVDIKTGETFKASPRYFTTNPIPHEIGENEETPAIDKLFSDWVGPENKIMLYEILAYCILSDYPIHTLFALIGSGRNGKSRYLELVNRFVGRTNVTSTELDDLLDNRFEKAKLYKKLVCVMGETNFGTIKKSSLIKKLCGQDLIGYELKNKNPFDDYNYAKILISSNSLPTSDDTSEGFYRRWIIIKFPNNFPEGKDILDTIPEREYTSLAKKSIKILKELLERASFTKQGSIEERKANYIMASNPLQFFIKEHCHQNENLYIKYNELYTHYSQYLLKNKQRVVSKREFSSILNAEGHHVDRTSKNIEGTYVNGLWVMGLAMKPNVPIVNDVNVVNDIHTNPPMRGYQVESDSQPAQDAQIENLNSGQETDGEGGNLQLGDFLSILLDKKDGWSVEKAILFGFSPKQIDVLIKRGEVYESPAGVLRLLK